MPAERETREARATYFLRATWLSSLRGTMDAQRLSLLKRKLETLNYDGELDPTSAPLTEKACHTRCVSISVSPVSAEALVKIC